MTSQKNKKQHLRPTTIYDRKQLGEGTTFLPGKKDPSVAHLINHILKNGYVILPSLFTKAQVDAANAELARLQSLNDSGPAVKGGRNPFEGFNTSRIYALADKSRIFDCFPIHETILKLNDYFLEPNYLLTSWQTVDVGPGSKRQEMHNDDGLIHLPRRRPLMGIGTMVALDDFTASNGATTLIPGSHLWSDDQQPTREAMVPAIMPSGSVVYFLNTVWHGGGENTSDKTRRSFTIQYCQPWIRTTENMTVATGWEKLDEIPKRLLGLLGFSTHDFMGYVDGRSPRAGVEMRKERLIEWGLERERERKKKTAQPLPIDRFAITGYSDTPKDMPKVYLLDYVAGNVRSLVNGIEKVGYTIEWIKSPEDIEKADKLILPGVGHFGHCMTQFSKAGYLPAIRKHIESGKPFMSICVGLQVLFEGSSESPSVAGLGFIKGHLDRFNDSSKSVPHIGWNSANTDDKQVYGLRPSSKYYYVHSYKVPYVKGELEAQGWTVATARYGDEEFVGAVAKGNILATQFHPEKSGVAGLRVLKAFLDGKQDSGVAGLKAVQEGLTRRVIACLDVRTNDQGDLVVTKGDQYDVREKGEGGNVRNLGKPVEMARNYYEQGADEVTFLNITSFRDCPLADLPMLEILRRTSETVFVPLTIGGGVRDTTDTDGTKVSALQIATMYFKSGADKVSIGSDAVTAAEEYYGAGKRLSGKTAIEQISQAYGNQAVVVSVDPKRVYVSNASETKHNTITTTFPGPNGESVCWYACTIKGGRETRDIDVVELTQAVEAMGAGEILLNCIDQDGTNSGFDFGLINQVKGAVKIPVIASSGAGNPGHFEEVFDQTSTDAALGAGMFHRGEYTVKDVKEFLEAKGLMVRRFESEI
ncbi:hypothetical protein HYALB_00014019 [Hymenoscyphus albidus]|uniref:Imidazole glycerol phosphate synthase hisHF n=1 Tax=Hymenoscyphus albidus TaxID=595503 RepID=A0A9N9QBG8_9HELO|nr:hypothetical protein HYALB_00014019 [Hymenoscyphus albidus]